MICIILLIIGSMLISSIVPLIQYIISYEKFGFTKKYIFPNELCDFDLDDLSFEKIPEGKAINRMASNDRGWVHYPVGSIMDNDSFEKKKKEEYDLELP